MCWLPSPGPSGPATQAWTTHQSSHLMTVPLSSDESFIALERRLATFQCGAHKIMGYAPLSQCVWQGNTDVAATPELATCQPICHANCPFCCLPAGTFSRLKMQSMQC